MSCGPLNAELTSSINCTINGPSFFSDFENVSNKFTTFFLNFTISTERPLGGLLTSSLECDSFHMPFGVDKDNFVHGFNLNAELSSSMPLQVCTFPE